MASETLQCCSCKETYPVGEVNVWSRGEKSYARCKACANWGKRCAGILKTKSPQVQDVFNNLSQEDKKSFLLEHKSLVGESLGKAMACYAERSRKLEASESFKGTGEFLDEDEVRARFQGKDKQIESILKNANQLECPVREVTLYEVPKYTVDKVQKRSMEETQAVSLSTEDKIKKQKSEPAAKVRITKNPNKAKLRRAEAKLAERHQELQECLLTGGAEAYSQFTPAPILAAATLAATKATEEVSLLQLAQQEDWKGNADELLQSSAKATQTAREFTQKLLKYFAEAEKMMPSSQKQQMAKAEKKES